MLSENPRNRTHSHRGRHRTPAGHAPAGCSLTAGGARCRRASFAPCLWSRANVPRRHEVGCELLEHRRQADVVEPRIAGPVDRADQVAVGVELHRLAALGHGLLEDLAAALVSICGIAVSLRITGRQKDLVLHHRSPRTAPCPSGKSGSSLLPWTSDIKDARGASGRLGASGVPARSVSDLDG